MQSRRVVFAFVAFLSTVAACATGTVPVGGGGAGGNGDGTDSGSTSSYGPADGGSVVREGGPTRPVDSGTTTPVDSGTTTIDSGTPPTGDNCVGPDSTQLGDTYDNACDNYYFNTGGDSNNCRSGKNDCAALDGTSGFDKFCCFVAPSGSFCNDDYAGTPQCIPQ